VRRRVKELMNLGCDEKRAVTGRNGRDDLQELLEAIVHVCRAAWDVQRMDKRPGLGIPWRTLECCALPPTEDPASSLAGTDRLLRVVTFTNRPLRTRMVGGVGAWS